MGGKSMVKPSRKMGRHVIFASLLPLLFVVPVASAQMEAPSRAAAQPPATPAVTAVAPASAESPVSGSAAPSKQLSAKDIAAIVEQAAAPNGTTGENGFCYYLGIGSPDPRFDPGISRNSVPWPSSPNGPQPTPVGLGPNGNPAPPSIEYCHPAPPISLILHSRP